MLLSLHRNKYARIIDYICVLSRYNNYILQFIIHFNDTAVLSDVMTYSFVMKNNYDVGIYNLRENLSHARNYTSYIV